MHYPKSSPGPTVGNVQHLKAEEADSGLPPEVSILEEYDPYEVEEEDAEMPEDDILYTMGSDCYLALREDQEMLLDNQEAPPADPGRAPPAHQHMQRPVRFGPPQLQQPPPAVPRPGPPLARALPRPQVPRPADLPLPPLPFVIHRVTTAALLDFQPFSTVVDSGSEVNLITVNLVRGRPWRVYAHQHQLRGVAGALTTNFAVDIPTTVGRISATTQFVLFEGFLPAVVLGAPSIRRFLLCINHELRVSQLDAQLTNYQFLPGGPVAIPQVWHAEALEEPEADREDVQVLLCLEEDRDSAISISVEEENGDIPVAPATKEREAITRSVVVPATQEKNPSTTWKPSQTEDKSATR
ncbi:hypothetical protein TYRP_005641 [Tyrophagus putrescentiae]|nr:hypothetical protein TYRP_005641 [Tyrophagus putrescentiae]